MKNRVDSVQDRAVVISAAATIDVKVEVYAVRRIDEALLQPLCVIFARVTLAEGGVAQIFQQMRRCTHALPAD